MAVTYGFYNSVGGDRLYNAVQMSMFFDGIITDGVYAEVGDHFLVTAYTAMTIRVGTGRGWYNHTWTYNDSLLSLVVDTADPLLDRIDVVCLRVNLSSGVRANSIYILEGTPSSNPLPPGLQSGPDIYEYPLAHIYVKAGATYIETQDITQKAGTIYNPYVESGIYSPIAPGSVGPTELATDAVTPGKIADGAINASALFSTGVINSNAIGAEVVTQAKIGLLAVGNGQIADSAVTPIKIANRTRRLFISASDMRAVTAEYIYTTAWGYGMAFDKDLSDHAATGFCIPLDWGGGNVSIKLVWTVPTSFVGNIYWKGFYSRMSNGSGIGGPLVEIGNYFVSPGLNVCAITEIGSFSVSGNEIVNILLLRHGGNANDTYNDDAHLIGMIVDYTADS